MARLVIGVLASLALGSTAALAQAAGRSAIVGSVVAEDGRPLDGVRVRAARVDGTEARETVTDARGTFRIVALPPGIYAVTVRRIGYRSAELPALRVAADTTSVRVTLTQAPRRLSTVVVETSPTAVDAGTPELPM